MPPATCQLTDTRRKLFYGAADAGGIFRGVGCSLPSVGRHLDCQAAVRFD